MGREQNPQVIPQECAMRELRNKKIFIRQSFKSSKTLLFTQFVSISSSFQSFCNMERTIYAGTLFGVVQKDVLKRKNSIYDENLLYLNQNDSKNLRFRRYTHFLHNVTQDGNFETFLMRHDSKVNANGLQQREEEDSF